MEDMKSLVTVSLAVFLVLPVGLSAQAGNANPPAQAPATSGAGNAPAENTSAKPSQPLTDSHKSKKKVKKSSCVSPPADSGLPDYCRNPYWNPKDWDYIRSNNSPGGTR
jgi:hypothetical protein